MTCKAAIYFVSSPIPQCEKGLLEINHFMNLSPVKMQKMCNDMLQPRASGLVQALRHLTYVLQLYVSPVSLLFFHLLSPSLRLSTFFIPSVSGQTDSGEEEGRRRSDKRGQSRHHSRLHPSHRCVSANDLMNTSPAD